jgi:tetratricopeptide (TPR) repeat protein
LFVLALAPAFSQSAFTRGEELLMRNLPAQALPVLEEALEEDPANIKAYLYLALTYQQLNRPEDAVAVYLKALPRGGAEAPRIAYNLGNAYFSQGNTAQAKRYYSEAIQADPAFSSAYLNRANALVKEGALAEAVKDYRYYLTLEPQSTKRAQVERMVGFIHEEFAAAEQALVTAERRRQEEAELARVEAERKQRLLEEISASLKKAAEETQGLSAGNESVMSYEGEFELEE